DLRVVARLAFLLVHVAEGIDENQQAEERHEDEHQRAEVVDQERDPDLVSGDAGEPDVAGDRLGREIPANGALSEDLDEDVEREDERAEHRRDGDVATAVSQPSSEEADDDEGGEGQQQDEPGDPGVLDHGSPFQEADFVELDRAVGLVDGEEHREADRRLRRGDRDPEEGEDLAAGISTVRREGDEVEDRGVQDDLDGHEHDDPVPAGEDAVEPDAQQGPGKQELVFQGNQGPTFPGSSIFARYTPPIIAAARRIAIKMIVIAKASNNWFAIPLDDVAFGSYTGTEGQGEPESGADEALVDDHEDGADDLEGAQDEEGDELPVNGHSIRSPFRRVPGPAPTSPEDPETRRHQDREERIRDQPLPSDVQNLIDPNARDGPGEDDEEGGQKVDPQQEPDFLRHDRDRDPADRQCREHRPTPTAQVENRNQRAGGE